MSIAANCTEHIKQLLTATELFGGAGQKIFPVYSEEDLMDKSKLLAFPSIGIMYEGLRADGLDSSGQGLSVNLRVALVLLLNATVFGVDMKNEATRLLDMCRTAIAKKKAPTLRPWVFLEEVPAGVVQGKVALSLYLQRWQTKVILN